jgi:hypothetical protein
VKANQHFPDDLLAALQKTSILRIRAGTGAHRFIGIWFVVVDGRVLVRSWSLKPGGWYRTLLKEPRGAIQVGKSEIPVRAKAIRTERLRSAVDRAYLAKYNTKGAIKYAKDLASPKSRATTLELVPMSEPKT